MTGPLPDWLLDPGLQPVWVAARARLERNGTEPRGMVTVPGLDRAGRHALSGLTGRPVVAERVRVDLPALDAVLRERSGCGGLVAVLEHISGPVRNRAAERSCLAQTREQPYSAARLWLRQHPQAAGLPWVEEWLAGLRRSGLVSRLPPETEPATVLLRALEIATGLTGTAQRTPISRTQLAAKSTSDAHALDHGRTLAHLVLRALAADAGEPPPLSVSGRRRLWERYGVSADGVSSTCLTLGLRPEGSDPLARRLRLAADEGAPVHVTGWDLSRGELLVPAGGWVLVCENPSVLETIAERRGGDIAVVCTSGMPGLVTVDVLRRLSTCSAVLNYHGDFDWPGIAIANRLVAQIGCLPWLMSAADYLAGVHGDGPVLVGAPVAPVWDPALGSAMHAHRVGVHEEAVLVALVAALPG